MMAASLKLHARYKGKEVLLTFHHVATRQQRALQLQTKYLPKAVHNMLIILFEVYVICMSNVCPLFTNLWRVGLRVLH